MLNKTNIRNLAGTIIGEVANTGEGFKAIPSPHFTWDQPFCKKYKKEFGRKLAETSHATYGEAKAYLLEMQEAWAADKVLFQVTGTKSADDRFKFYWGPGEEARYFEEKIDGAMAWMAGESIRPRSVQLDNGYTIELLA